MGVGPPPELRDTVSGLYDALRSAYAADPDGRALVTPDGLVYSWHDLDRGSAMMAHLLASLGVAGAPCLLAQVAPSPEAVMLHLAAVRLGWDVSPLPLDADPAEVEWAIASARPAVVVCDPERFGRVSKRAFCHSTRAVFTLGADRTGTLLDRAAHHPDAWEASARGPG